MQAATAGQLPRTTAGSALGQRGRLTAQAVRAALVPRRAALDAAHPVVGAGATEATLAIVAATLGVTAAREPLGQGTPVDTKAHATAVATLLAAVLVDADPVRAAHLATADAGR